jgi:hypothetical protein
MSASSGFMLRVVTELKQGVLLGRRDQDDVAAVPAIAAARSTARDVLLPPKRKTAVSAIAGLYENSCLIEEQHRKAAGPNQNRRPFGKKG